MDSAIASEQTVASRTKNLLARIGRPSDIGSRSDRRWHRLLLARTTEVWSPDRGHPCPPLRTLRLRSPLAIAQEPPLSVCSAEQVPGEVPKKPMFAYWLRKTVRYEPGWPIGSISIVSVLTCSSDLVLSRPRLIDPSAVLARPNTQDGTLLSWLKNERDRVHVS